jgi:O-antigen/teichoic acid export membrane protein
MKIPIVKNFYVKSSLFTILSLAAAACSYALIPILVRVMPPSDFGDFAVTTTMLNQVLAFLLAINIISIHLVKTYGEDDARRYVQIIQKALLWLFMAVCILVVTFSPFLKTILKIDNLLLFLPLSLVLLASVPVTVWNGFLQGHKELIRVGIFSVSASLSKLIFASVLGLFLGSVGALFGILIGTLLGIIVLQLYPGVRLPSLKNTLQKTNKSDLRSLWQLKFYIIQAVFVVGALGFLQGYDISLAKILFEPAIAGTYSGIGVLSYILYYLAFILIWIILPEINVQNPVSNRRVLGTAYKIFGMLAITAIAFEVIFGNLLLSILLGADYSEKVSWLIFATLYQLTLVAIAHIPFTFLCAIRHEQYY